MSSIIAIRQVVPHQGWSSLRVVWILRKARVARPPDQVGGKLLGRVFISKEVWRTRNKKFDNMFVTGTPVRGVDSPC